MKALLELLYNLAALALVGAFAYYWFWALVFVLGPLLLATIALMTLEYAMR